MPRRNGPPDGRDGQRTLRILILAPISLLVLAIVAFSAMAGHFNDSISAYYGGPVRDVFVGSLVATSLGLLAYRGVSDLEDVALNGAGFFAPFVAFVPYDFATSAANQVRTETAVDAATSLKLVLVCYLAAALAFAIVDYLKGTWAVGGLWRSSVWSRLLLWAALAGVAVHVALVGVRMLEPDTTFSGVHATAAVLLIASMVIAVASHVVHPRHRGALRPDGRQVRHGVAVLYRWIVAGMVLGGPAVWGVLRWAGVSGAIFWTETLEISFFLVFWVSEVRRHWSAAPAGPSLS